MRFKMYDLFMFLTRTREYSAAIIYGELSGYPMCDIFWFLVRIKLMRELGWYRNLMMKVGYNKNYHHIPCPLCRLKNFILRKLPTYHTCQKCGWQQLEDSECRVCPMPSKLKKELELPVAKRKRTPKVKKESI